MQCAPLRRFRRSAPFWPPHICPPASLRSVEQRLSLVIPDEPRGQLRPFMVNKRLRLFPEFGMRIGIARAVAIRRWFCRAMLYCGFGGGSIGDAFGSAAGMSRGLGPGIAWGKRLAGVCRGAGGILDRPPADHVSMFIEVSRMWRCALRTQPARGTPRAVIGWKSRRG